MIHPQNVSKIKTKLIGPEEMFVKLPADNALYRYISGNPTTDSKNNVGYEIVGYLIS